MPTALSTKVEMNENAFRAFRPNGDGSWTTIHPIAVTNQERIIGLGRGVTLEPGDVLIGLDIARWLENGCRVPSGRS
jgi:hypothetical protein